LLSLGRRIVPIGTKARSCPHYSCLSPRLLLLAKGWKERSKEDRIEIERQQILTEINGSSKDIYLSTRVVCVKARYDYRSRRHLYFVSGEHLSLSLLFHGRSRPDFHSCTKERFSLAFIKKKNPVSLIMSVNLSWQNCEIQERQVDMPTKKTITTLSSCKDVDDFLRLQAHKQQEEYIRLSTTGLRVKCYLRPNRWAF